MNDAILEPISYYKSVLKDKVNQAAIDAFDELTKKSNVDVAANRKTIKELKDAQKELDEANKKLSNAKTGKAFSVVGIILSVFIGILLIVLSSLGNLSLGIGLGIGIPLLFVAIGLVVLIFTYINKRIKHYQVLQDRFEEIVSALNSKAWEQMASLNELYDYSTSYKIFNKCTEIVKFDDYFARDKLQYLVENCDYWIDDDPTHSTLYVKSGQILGNPFIIRKTKYQNMGSHVYTGTRVVTYTVSYRDSDGNYHTRVESETLVATLSRPAPYYGYYTQLVYGNQAAPNLTFSRKPTNLDPHLEQKKKDKMLRKAADDLDDLAQKAVSNGGNFTPLSNTEFEAYFDALDRNNESQFRLLFTPLAQKNMMDLFESEYSYGDDFRFIKQNRTNIIQSSHMQTVNLSCDPSIFVSNDYDGSRLTFINYMNEFFRSMFFDFAPLISIPLYQQMKTKEYIYNTPPVSNNTMYECEMAANIFDEFNFKDPRSRTEAILKASFIQKDGEADKVTVTAHSFEGIDRVDYVPVMAGNGHLYDVPVHWIEYLPIEKDTPLEVRRLDTTRPEFKDKLNSTKFGEYVNGCLQNHIYFDKLFAFIDTYGYCDVDDKQFINMFNETKQED